MPMFGAEGAPVTRSALLERKERIGIAKQGQQLLMEKRRQLLQELMREADRVMVGSGALEEAAVAAREALGRARVFAGPEGVESAAMTGRDEIPVDVRVVNVSGVEIPEIEYDRVERSSAGRGYAPTGGTSVTIDEAAAAFEEEIDRLLDLAVSELRLRRLAREVQRTTRRVNALEHVILPRLRQEIAYIADGLAERERVEQFRLRRVKGRR